MALKSKKINFTLYWSIFPTALFLKKFKSRVWKMKKLSIFLFLLWMPSLISMNEISFIETSNQKILSALKMVNTNYATLDSLLSWGWFKEHNTDEKLFVEPTSISLQRYWMVKSRPKRLTFGLWGFCCMRLPIKGPHLRQKHMHVSKQSPLVYWLNRV